ncbi:MAG: Fe-S cluster assembly protein SufD [Planctomycetota bacterium]|jgi:Fe-S cluster assembly protein SufD
MAAQQQDTATFVEAFAALERSEPTWLADRRRLAIERFSLLGIPTTRDEEYKYTGLKSIAGVSWSPATGATADLPDTDYAGEESARIVFIDGTLATATGDASLLNSLNARINDLEGHLTRYADFESHALTALNTAFFTDGAVVEIPEGTVVEKPIHIVWVSTGQAGVASHPRTLILAGRNSQASVIESFVSTGDGASWTNAVTEIVAEENGRIEHFHVQQEGDNAIHTSFIEGLTERSGYISTISLSFGAQLARNDVKVKLNGEGAECALDGLFVVSDKQHVDHHTTIDHASAHCNSHQLYKGVLDDQSRGVFNGKIIVRKDAQKTDAIQNNNNLLLSRKAEIDTKPQLEIDANDVRCTHGATIGQLDAEALFYLQSRGIGKSAARNLLTYAFAADLLERVNVEPLRDHFEHVLMRALSEDPSAEETHA